MGSFRRVALLLVPLHSNRTVTKTACTNSFLLILLCEDGHVDIPPSDSTLFIWHHITYIIHAVVNTYIYFLVLAFIVIPLGYVSRSGLSRSCGNSMFSYLGNCPLSNGVIILRSCQPCTRARISSQHYQGNVLIWGQGLGLKVAEPVWMDEWMSGRISMRVQT